MLVIPTRHRPTPKSILPKVRMIRLSMNELSTMRWSFEEDVVEYSQAGFDGIGIWRQKLSDVDEDFAIDFLDRHDIRCSNLMWAGGFTGSEGLSFRESVFDAVSAVRTASRLQCDSLVIYGGSWGGHTRKHACRLVTNAIAQILPFAEEFGVNLAIEPMHPGCGGGWTFLESIEETLEMVEHIQSDRLKLVLDTYQSGFGGIDTALLSEIAHKIAVVHLGDGLCEPSGEQNRCRLGDGVIDIEQIIDVLLANGYQGFFDVELLGESVEAIDYPSLLLHAREYVASLAAVARS